MDREVIERKLESLRHCIERIQSKRPGDATRLASDLDLQDVLVLNLSRAVQVCVDIAAHVVSATHAAVPGTMGEAFSRLADAGIIDTSLAQRLRRAVGFRNIAVHNYDAIDWDIVMALTGAPLEDFRQFAQQILAFIDRPRG